MSYASEIECRAIYNNWNSYSRGVGRLRIRGLSEERPDSRYYGNRIGTEVCWNGTGNTRYYNNAENNGSNWILRVYADGTAYFYPNKLRHFNNPTSNSISQMVYKHFRVIKAELPENITGYAGSYHHERLEILRRRPVGQLSRKYFVKSLNFGEYLANKYNDLEGSNEDAE